MQISGWILPTLGPHFPSHHAQDITRRHAAQVSLCIVMVGASLELKIYGCFTNANSNHVSLYFSGQPNRGTSHSQCLQVGQVLLGSLAPAACLSLHPNLSVELVKPSPTS